MNLDDMVYLPSICMGQSFKVSIWPFVVCFFQFCKKQPFLFLFTFKLSLATTTGVDTCALFVVWFHSITKATYIYHWIIYWLYYSYWLNQWAQIDKELFWLRFGILELRNRITKLSYANDVTLRVPNSAS